MRLFAVASLAAAVAAFAQADREPGMTPDYALKGCGVREIMLFDAYRLSLFEGPRRGEAIVMDVLTDGGVPDGLPDDWLPVLRETLSDDVIAEIDAAFGLVEADSRVEIGVTTGPELSYVRVDDVTAVSVPGRRVYEAVKSRWFGDEPISDELKQTILAGECEAA